MQVRLNITLCFALRRYEVNSGCQLDLDAVYVFDLSTDTPVQPFPPPTSTSPHPPFRTHTHARAHAHASITVTYAITPTLTLITLNSLSVSKLHCCNDSCSSHGTVLSPRCSGSTRWVHQRCILRWINDPDHTCGADRRGCPNGCGAIYTLSEAPESLLVQVKWMPLPHSPHACTRQGQPALIISPVPSSSWSSQGA